MDVPPTVATHGSGASSPLADEPVGPEVRLVVRAACRLALATPVLWLLGRGAVAGLRGDLLPALAALGAVGWLAAVAAVLAAGITASTSPPFMAGRLGDR